MSIDSRLVELSGLSAEVDFTVPAAEMAKELGTVIIRKSGDALQVQVSLLLEPQEQLSKVWNTGVALDASASMKKTFGRRLLGNIPAGVAQEYEEKGWLKKEHRDGHKVKTFSRTAVDDAINRGLVSLTPNTMDYLGSEYITYMARHLDVEGSVSVIYWAGGDGSSIELFGDINEAAGANLSLDGPDKMEFGRKTLLLPAVKYFIDRFKYSSLGMFVFITDGHIEDLAEVQQYTQSLVQEIIAGRRGQVKCILIGIGDEIDEKQLGVLDSLESRNFWNIWDHMIVTDYQEVLKMFVEIIQDSKIVAKEGTIYDSQGKALKRYSAGVPTRLVFSMPVTSSWFELEIAGQRIRQSVKIPKYGLGG